MAQGEKAVCLFEDINRLPGSDSQTYLEMCVCQKRGVPYFFLRGDIGMVAPTEEDATRMLAQHELEKGLADREIGDYLVFPKTIPGYECAIHDIITGYGGNVVISNDDIRKVDNWPLYVLPEFVNRRIGIIRAGDLAEEIKKYAEGSRVFAKTKLKTHGHGTVLDAEELMSSPRNGLPAVGYWEQPGRRFYNPVSPDTELILSQPMTIKRDEKGNLEYRLWVTAGNIATIKRHVDANESIPGNVADFCLRLVSAHRSILPQYYVADVAVTPGGIPVVIELNSALAYGWNDKPEIIMEIFAFVLKTFIEKG